MPYQELENRYATQRGRDQRIPKTLYQTFSVPFFGKSHFKELQNFRKTNPELDFIFFSEEDRDQWMQEHWGGTLIHEIFCNLQFGPAKADIFRYCILFKQGGYYFDISKACRVPLTSLHEAKSDCLISFEKNDLYYPPDSDVFNVLLEPNKYVLQWGMGFVSEHPILRKVISNIELDYHLYKNRVFQNPKIAILMFTGPGQFTKAVRQTLKEYPNSNIIQAGQDFNGQGIFSLKGAEVRYLHSPSYAEVRNTIIVK